MTRSRDVRVRGNVVHDNASAGVLVANSDHVTVTRNVAFDQRDGDGILLVAGAHEDVLTPTN